MLSLFFVPEISDGSKVTVEGDEAHHAIKVMRMELGEEIQVADGKGNWAQGRIVEIDKEEFHSRLFLIGAILLGPIQNSL
jgi:16S rRNA (uracil1498-N3)-methyltransferase